MNDKSKAQNKKGVGSQPDEKSLAKDSPEAEISSTLLKDKETTNNTTATQDENKNDGVEYIINEFNKYKSLLKTLKNPSENESKNYLDWAKITCVIGIVFFGIAISLPIVHWIVTKIWIYINFINSVNLKIAELDNSTIITGSIICIVCGLTLEIVALVLFYFYGDSLAQQEEINRVLLADIMCERLDTQSKNKARSKIIKALVLSETESQDKLKEVNKDSKKNSSTK